MPRAKKSRSFKLPEVRLGNWRGEIVGGCTVSFGQIVQDGPPRQSVELTYMIVPAALTMPEPHFTWPGIIMIMTPTPMKTEFPDAGSLFKSRELPSLSLSLEVTRDQFSDMLRMMEARHLKDFHFTVEDGSDDSWPIHSWGMAAAFA
ncbi:hypothetical protein [Rhizobium sp. BK060]|uniref:hypothetical protein n=1 Tax=Rhizobium sp. BK060 TaxID=2587096 RepID=UPI00161C7E4E|nr:hypothetical protein [Rhizobium sp. BK060]MBB3399690.1 hypothetical protein [Rhizobium sp. BK060]